MFYDPAKIITQLNREEEASDDGANSGESVFICCDLMRLMKFQIARK